MSAPAVTASGYLGFGRTAYGYLVAGGLAIAVYGFLWPSGSGDAVFVAIGAAAAAAVVMPKPDLTSTLQKFTQTQP